MLYLPVSLLLHLHDHDVKMPEFDKALENWYENAPLDLPEYYVSTFFGEYLKLPVPVDEEIRKFFRELGKAKEKYLEMPLYLMPPEFVYDIKYDKIKEELIATPVQWSEVFKPRTMRKGQLDLLTKMLASKSRLKIMVAPTGLGKTWTLLAYARARGLKSLIIEPEKGMESQLQYGYNVPIIMGMQHYKCLAEDVPASVSGCRVAGKNSPCGKGCAWHDTISKMITEINKFHPVAVNPGNFWTWIGKVGLVIVDEYHKVFSQLTSQHNIPANVKDENAQDWLAGEVEALDSLQLELYAQLKSLKASGVDIPNKMWQKYDAVQHELRWKKLFLDNFRHVLIYERNNTKYMKLDKEGTVNYFASLYPDKEIVFVSATPMKVSGAETIETKESVTTKVNAPIIYYPVGNLSANSVSANPEYLESAASVIMDMFRHFSDKGTTKKIIVHSGNTGMHGEAISQLLRDNGLKVMQHKKGALMETIERFRQEDYDALVVASADAGYDFYGDVFGLQFILKVPYPTLGDEWVAIENKYGRSYRWELYADETISQIVQASGRICRGSDDVGITMILDEKFAKLYNSHLAKFPDSFKERLYDIAGTLKNTAPSWQLEHYNKVE